MVLNRRSNRPRFQLSTAQYSLILSVPDRIGPAYWNGVSLWVDRSLQITDRHGAISDNPTNGTIEKARAEVAPTPLVSGRAPE